MKAIKIFGIMIAMLLLVVTMVSAVKPSDPVTFAEGLTIDINDVDDQPLNTPLYLYGYVYDSATGVLVTNATCGVDLHYGIEKTEIFDITTDFQTTVTMNATLFNQTGIYQSDIYCESTDGLQGGFTTISFEVNEETRFGIWKPVEDWTFPAIYLIIVFILLAIALAYESQMLGVLGSVMLIMAYFLVGATSPILFTPLLIVGFLLAFKFATL